jgi:pyrroline-5-carboxylate reductase
MARGWVGSKSIAPENIYATRRREDESGALSGTGVRAGTDNVAAVNAAQFVVIAVQPQQLVALLEEVRGALDPGSHRIISVVSGVSIAHIARAIGKPVSIVRAMPNTAVGLRQSMTCLSAAEGAHDALGETQSLFDLVGRTLVVREEMMVPATALCACGVAFFLRAIRAASQGGIEIGFHPHEALLLAAQTANGSASLLLHDGKNHPESEIDRVTTPRGCTIAGLNEMEHKGFSSAMIKGILLSAEKAGHLFDAEE